MSGTGTRANAGRRARRLAVRVALAAGMVTLSLFGAPGQASAAGTLTPLLDCIVQNSNGTVTAVLGFSNTTGHTVNIKYGDNNVITPSTFDRTQPTHFKAGTRHGVFSVTLTYNDFWSSPSWRLNGHTLDYYDAGHAVTCPPGTTMPATGNGTGPALALVAAGVVGMLFVRRDVRRARAAASTPGGVHA
jgi:hypothetical protein